MPGKADIWMPLYIGDYLSDTSHLTAEESGAYLHLLMHSWKSGPLPSENEDIRRIARVERDAWSNAWRKLQTFFKQCSDGSWIQPRLEKERQRWQEKKESSVKKASTAAKARWENASSTPKAMLESCPSSLPSPLPIHTKEQKPSRPKAASDPRYQPFVDVCQRYAKHFNLPFRFGAADGKQLKTLLAEVPALQEKDFQRALWNRSQSDGTTNGDAPRVYLPTITKYLEGALDQYGKRKNAVTKPDQATGNGAVARQSRNLDDLARVAGRRYGIGPYSVNGGNSSAVPSPGNNGAHSGDVPHGMGGDGFEVRDERISGRIIEGDARLGT